MRNPNTQCSICKKPFYRRRFEFKEGIEFCCRGCRSELYKRKPSIWQSNIKLGQGWNKGKSKVNGDILLYGRPRNETTKQRISDKLKLAWVRNQGLRKFYDTDIEIILESWLKENNIKYEKQKQLLNITVVDFFIPPNICLYADGDYWHSIPKVRQRDGLIYKTLRQNNYTVIRLLGSQIKKGVRPLVLLSQ